MGCLTVSAVLQLHHAFLSAQWQMRRLLLYSLSVFTGLGPVLHWVVLQGGFYSGIVMVSVNTSYMSHMASTVVHAVHRNNLHLDCDWRSFLCYQIP